MSLPKSYGATLVAWAQREPLIKAVYVFGSYAKGTQRPGSDLDVALRLELPTDEAFTELVWNRRRWSEQLTAAVGVPVEIYLYEHLYEDARTRGYLKASVVVYESS